MNIIDLMIVCKHSCPQKKRLIPSAIKKSWSWLNIVVSVIVDWSIVCPQQRDTLLYPVCMEKQLRENILHPQHLRERLHESHKEAIGTSRDQRVPADAEVHIACSGPRKSISRLELKDRSQQYFRLVNLKSSWL